MAGGGGDPCAPPLQARRASSEAVRIAPVIPRLHPPCCSDCSRVCSPAPCRWGLRVVPPLLVPSRARAVKTGSSGGAPRTSSSICSTVGGAGRVGSTTRFLALEPIPGGEKKGADRGVHLSAFSWALPPAQRTPTHPPEPRSRGSLPRPAPSGSLRFWLSQRPTTWGQGFWRPAPSLPQFPCESLVSLYSLTFARVQRPTPLTAHFRFRSQGGPDLQARDVHFLPLWLLPAPRCEATPPLKGAAPSKVPVPSDQTEEIRDLSLPGSRVLEEHGVGCCPSFLRCVTKHRVPVFWQKGTGRTTHGAVVGTQLLPTQGWRLCQFRVGCQACWTQVGVARLLDAITVAPLVPKTSSRLGASPGS